MAPFARVVTSVAVLVCVATSAAVAHGSVVTALRLDSVTVAGAAGGLAAHDKVLFVGSESKGITEIDAASGDVTKVFAPPAGFEMSTSPTSIAYGIGGLWATGVDAAAADDSGASAAPAVRFLDLASGEWTRDIPFPLVGEFCGADAVAATGAAVWVSYSCYPVEGESDEKTACQIERVDPTSGTTVATFALGRRKNRGDCAIAAEPTGVWVVSQGEDVVWRLDPTTNIAGDPVELDAGSHSSWSTTAALASGRGALWTVVTCCERAADSRLLRLDPRTGEITKTQPLGFSSLRTPLASVAIGGGSIWIAQFNKVFSDTSDRELPGTLLRLDARGLGRQARLTTRPEPVGALYLDGSLWLTHNLSRRVTRVHPA